MRSHTQGCGGNFAFPFYVVLLAAAWGGCTPIPPENGQFEWPTASSMAIWPVSPADQQVLGRDGASLAIAWNDAVVAKAQPVITLRLVPDPNEGDPNTGKLLLAEGLDAAADGAADRWAFDGFDANNAPVRAGVYRVEYTIDDGVEPQTKTSEGTLTVPLRFTSPAGDVTLFQTAGLLIEWESQFFAGTISRLDLGLSVDPNDSNDIAWLNREPLIFGGAVTSLSFEGTVYDPNDPNEPNGHIIQPNTYVLRARIWPSSGQGPFFIPAPGRVTIVADPNI